MAFWDDAFRKQFGHLIPESYLCFDCETTGVNVKEDLPVQIGHALVADRELITQSATLVDWTREPSVDQDWLRARMDRVQHIMQEKGADFDITYDKIHEEGKPPEEVLGFYLSQFEKTRKEGFGFVGHNAIAFDAVLLRRCFNEYLDEDWWFEGHEVFDTGAMEKAIQMKRVPDPDEDLSAYFTRIRHAWGKGILWSVDHCLKKYNLIEKYALKASAAHDAGFDSYICHLLIEQHRKAILGDEA